MDILFLNMVIVVGLVLTVYVIERILISSLQLFKELKKLWRLFVSLSWGVIVIEF
jgi:hypothetical protein